MAKQSKAAAVRNAEVEAAKEQRNNIGVTDETVAEAISGAFASLATINDPVLKTRGDNGQLFDIDAMLPAGVDPECHVEVNRFAYIVGQLVNGLTWKLETMLHDKFERLKKSERTLAYMRQECDHGRRSQSEVDKAQDWVDRFEEEVTVLAAAFDRALTEHEAQTGKPFLRKAERDAAAIARKRAGSARSEPKVSDALAEKMKAMGVA